MILEPLDLETQYQPKVEATKILEQIYSDLDDAIGLLPDKMCIRDSGMAEFRIAIGICRKV